MGILIGEVERLGSFAAYMPMLDWHQSDEEEEVEHIVLLHGRHGNSKSRQSSWFPSHRRKRR
jgi:hypothetical protein